MITLGIIHEGKNPPDVRVPLTPKQCKEILNKNKDIHILVQHSPTRCFKDEDYVAEGIEMTNNLSNCDIILGVKEVPDDKLIADKTFFFFSHTKKKQPYNQHLMQTLIEKKIRMIDYETLTYEDGQRILGFGFFAGVVGAHNGLLTYGKKHNNYNLRPAHQCFDMEDMLAQYLNIQLPPVKIAVTGSGRVTSGILEVMHRLDIESVEPEDFLHNTYEYPVYTLLKGSSLYQNKKTKTYSRDEFHHHPEMYECKFNNYLAATDILMNGIYWDEKIDRLFEKEDITNKDFNISVIADITCDINGSVPINIGASTIANPVYGYDKTTGERALPFQNDKNIIDIMAVDNLPNELPRDASKHFGEHIIKYILPEILKPNSSILQRATICENGLLTPHFDYLSDYAYKN